jgi:ubiquinone/menaquinone biosynthesis C-methylase UbiE
LNILEVGCGNGWMAHRLAEIPGSKVTGLDVNLTELQQAVRVFNHIPNLQFIYGDINANETDDTQYDFIVFAASIQYFPSLKEIITHAMRKLRSNGEIHIIDSNFYKPGEIGAAKERTANYYSDLGFPEMTKQYFHHSTDELNIFHFKTLYQPSFINRLSNHKNPFPWLCIEKQ